MPIFILLALLPVGLGLITEYLVCRLLKKWFWRWLPPLAVFSVAALVFTLRLFGWSASQGGATAPIETLLIIPVLPASLALLGILAGWRIWKWRWTPRVVRDKKRK